VCGCKRRRYPGVKSSFSESETLGTIDRVGIRARRRANRWNGAHGEGRRGIYCPARYARLLGFLQGELFLGEGEGREDDADSDPGRPQVGGIDRQERGDDPEAEHRCKDRNEENGEEPPVYVHGSAAPRRGCG